MDTDKDKDIIWDLLKRKILIAAIALLLSNSSSSVSAKKKEANLKDLNDNLSSIDDIISSKKLKNSTIQKTNGSNQNLACDDSEECTNQKNDNTQNKQLSPETLRKIKKAVTNLIYTKKYLPYLQANGTRFFHVGKINLAFGGDLFFPIWQTQNKLFFTDLRFYERSGKIFEGNAHLGYRYLSEETQRIYGVYCAYDHRKTHIGNYFSQLTFGGEIWLNRFFVGANYYQPIGNTEKLIQGNYTQEYRDAGDGAHKNVWYVQDLKYEKALPGADAELGYEFIKGLVGYAGGYYFTAKDADTIVGPRVRFTYDFSRSNGKRILEIFDKIGLEAGIQKDKPRGITGYVGINLKIGLTQQKSNLEGVSRHMIDLVRRDVDVVANDAPIKREIPKLAKDGSRIAIVSVPVNEFTLLAAKDEYSKHKVDEIHVIDPIKLIQASTSHEIALLALQQGIHTIPDMKIIGTSPQPFEGQLYSVKPPTITTNDTTTSTSSLVLKGTEQTTLDAVLSSAVNSQMRNYSVQEDIITSVEKTLDDGSFGRKLRAKNYQPEDIRVIIAILKNDIEQIRKGGGSSYSDCCGSYSGESNLSDDYYYSTFDIPDQSGPVDKAKKDAEVGGVIAPLVNPEVGKAKELTLAKQEEKRVATEQLQQAKKEAEAAGVTVSLEGLKIGEVQKLTTDKREEQRVALEAVRLKEEQAQRDKVAQELLQAEQLKQAKEEAAAAGVTASLDGLEIAKVKELTLAKQEEKRVATEQLQQAKKDAEAAGVTVSLEGLKIGEVQKLTTDKREEQRKAEAAEKEKQRLAKELEIAERGAVLRQAHTLGLTLIEPDTAPLQDLQQQVQHEETLRKALASNPNYIAIYKRPRDHSQPEPLFAQKYAEQVALYLEFLSTKAKSPEDRGLLHSKSAAAQTYAEAWFSKSTKFNTYKQLDSDGSTEMRVVKALTEDLLKPYSATASKGMVASPLKIAPSKADPKIGFFGPPPSIPVVSPIKTAPDTTVDHDKALEFFKQKDALTERQTNIGDPRVLDFFRASDGGTIL